MANLQVGVAGNGTVTVGAGASVHSPASNVLTLGTNGDERLRITSAGLVGMGVAAPAEALDVTGSIQASAGLKLATHPVVTYASFTDVSGGSYATRLGSTGSSTLRSTQIYAGGGHMATFDGVNTRLGIATAIPVTTLDVRGNMAVDYNATHALRFYTQPRNNWSSITNTATDGNANLSFKSSQGEAMFITYGRNIGIGTDNPGRKLEVWDASESNVRIEGGADYFEFRVKDSDNALTVHKNIAGGGSSEVLRIDSAGKVGVGENNPQSVLHLKSMSGVLSVDTYPQLTIETAATDGAANKGGGILFLNHDGSGGSFGGSIQSLKENATSGNTAHYMRFSTRAAGGALTERLRITSVGDIEYKYNDSDTATQIGGTQVPHGLRIYNTDNTLGRVSGINFAHGGAGTANAGIFHVTTNTGTSSGGCLGDLTFWTKASGSSYMSERLRINSTGQVTKQHSCAFHYTPNGNQTLSNGDTITSWKSTDSRGFENTSSGGYLSSGVFTAPVTGAYFMTAQLLLSDVGSGDTSIHLMWVKNTGTHTYWNTRFTGNSVGYGGYEAVIGSTTVYLTAGDTMKIAITLNGSVGFYGTDQNWGHWSGFLIG